MHNIVQLVSINYVIPFIYLIRKLERILGHSPASCTFIWSFGSLDVELQNSDSNFPLNNFDCDAWISQLPRQTHFFVNLLKMAESVSPNN